MELERHEWLALRTEAALEPDQRIVDPHHHLWDRGGSTYLAPQLVADTTGSHNVVKTVFVECKAGWDRDASKAMAPVGETVFVAAQAQEVDALGGPAIAGIVSHADMMLGDAIEEVLAAHDQAGNGRFRGIRHGTTWHASDEIPNSHTRSSESMMRTEEFHQAAHKLGEMGFSFDSWLYHPQLPELTDLAQSCPETLFIIDHLGGPLGIGAYAGKRDEVRSLWQSSMQHAATLDNMVLKVGGIGMDNYFGTGWAAADQPPSSEEVASYWGDDLRWCIDTFGPERCMFESNFPVDRQTLPYAVLWNALQIVASGYSADEQSALFAGTAERVYRLT